MRAYSRSMRGAHSSDAADVNFLGPHHFTLQEDTPLYWLDNGGPLQRYLLKVVVRARFRREDTVVAGCTFHSAYAEGALEPESGIWFWVEVRGGEMSYCLGGADLETKPTRIYGGKCFPLEEDGELLELNDSWKILVQGSYGCIFPRDLPRKLRLPFAARRPQGHVAFFNYSCTARDALEVDFRHLSFTLLNTGPAVPLQLSMRDPEDSQMDSFSRSQLEPPGGVSVQLQAVGELEEDDGPPAYSHRRVSGAVGGLPVMLDPATGALSRNASEPGLTVDYVAPSDVTRSALGFEPALTTKAHHARVDAARRERKASLRKSGLAPQPKTLPRRSALLSFK